MYSLVMTQTSSPIFPYQFLWVIYLTWIKDAAQRPKRPFFRPTSLCDTDINLITATYHQSHQSQGCHFNSAFSGSFPSLLPQIFFVQILLYSIILLCRKLVPIELKIIGKSQSYVHNLFINLSLHCYLLKCPHHM